MNRLSRFLKLKTIAVFALAFLVGLWAGGFFERYVFKFYFVESFSRGEAQNLTGKKVQDVCSTGEDSGRKGEVVNSSTDDFTDILAEIHWEKGFDGGYPKSAFKRCVKVLNDE